MKSLFGIVLVTTASLFMFSGCEKSILSDDPGSVDGRNITLRLLTYWNNYFLNKDSIYTVNNARLKIDDINILISDFYYSNNNDTLPPQDGFASTNSSESSYKIGLITESSIAGSVNFSVGLNPIVNLTDPSMYAAGEVLANESLWRGTNKGYNFITIKGRIFDPSKPNEVEPSIPLNWVVATNALLINKGKPKNFSIGVGKQVLIDANLRVDLLFDGMYPLANPIIKCDPADAIDFQLATAIHDNFNDIAFIIQ